MIFPTRWRAAMAMERRRRKQLSTIAANWTKGREIHRLVKTVSAERSVRRDDLRLIDAEAHARLMARLEAKIAESRRALAVNDGAGRAKNS